MVKTSSEGFSFEGPSSIKPTFFEHFLARHCERYSKGGITICAMIPMWTLANFHVVIPVEMYLKIVSQVWLAKTRIASIFKLNSGGALDLGLGEHVIVNCKHIYIWPREGLPWQFGVLSVKDPEASPK